MSVRLPPPWCAKESQPTEPATGRHPAVIGAGRMPEMTDQDQHDADLGQRRGIRNVTFKMPVSAEIEKFD